MRHLALKTSRRLLCCSTCACRSGSRLKNLSVLRGAQTSCSKRSSGMCSYEQGELTRKSMGQPLHWYCVLRLYPQTLLLPHHIREARRPFRRNTCIRTLMPSTQQWIQHHQRQRYARNERQLLHQCIGFLCKALDTRALCKRGAVELGNSSAGVRTTQHALNRVLLSCIPKV